MIDPVQQPTEYQALLLAQVGDRDPADVYGGLPVRVRAVVAGAGDRLRVRPAEGEWSAVEVIGHIVDAELMVAGRLRWILAQDEPALLGYDQDQWVAGQRHADADPEVLLAVMDALNPLNLGLWEGTSPEQRARVGIHAERGPESFDLTFRMLAGHGLLHLEQMEHTLAAVSGSS
ncbi:MAG TPA: DinB family protein [Actinomycetota bacterium]|nr:DinB family protein [Actinomycetota bacterium]